VRRDDAVHSTVNPSVAASLLRAEISSPELAAFESAVVSFFLDAAEMLGIPKSVAAIYSICFASTEPLSFADIHARLNISQGSISQGLRLLREVGALKVADQSFVAASDVRSLSSSVRTVRYEPDLELRKLVIHFLESRLAKQLESSHGALRLIAERVPVETDSANVLKARVQQIQNWHEKTRALLPLAKTFLKLT
jgi:DNA-binding transcriptional regulator GbsR (MarR family)